MKLIRNLALLFILLAAVISCGAAAADGETLYYNDFAGIEELASVTLTPGGDLNKLGLAVSSEGYSVLRLELLSGEGKNGYSYVKLPVISQSVGKKDDVAFEIRLKNSMNVEGFFTTTNKNHSFLVSGNNFKAGMYSPDKELGNLASFPYNGFKTVTVIYDSEESFRRLYLDGSFISVSGEGSDPNYGQAMNKWSKNGKLEIELWSYLKRAGHFTEIDYVKIYKLCEKIECSILYADAADTERIYLDFNTPVNITKDMIRIDGITVSSCALYDRENNIYEIIPGSELRNEREYTLSLNGVTELTGKTYSESLSFRTRGDVVYKPVVFIQNGVEGDVEFSNAPVSASVTVKNPYEEKKSFTLYLAGYSVNANGEKALVSGAIAEEELESGELKVIASKELVLDEETDLLYAYVWCGQQPVTSAVAAKNKEYIPPAGKLPAFKDTELLGEAAFARSVCKSATGLTPLGYRTYISFVGTPAYIYEFDTFTGEYINKFPAGTGQHTCLCVGSDGMLYHIPYGGGHKIYKYNPVTRENTEVVKFSDKSSGLNWRLYPGADDDNSTLYSMLHNYNYATEGHTLVEFDVATGTVKTYDGIDVGCRYAHGATGNDKYAFVSSGDTGGTEKITRINKETNERLVWKNDTGYTIGNVGYIKVSGDMVFILLGTRMIAVDIETMTTKYDYKPYVAFKGMAVPKPGSSAKYIYAMNPEQTALRYYLYKSGALGGYSAFTNPISGIGNTDFGTWVKNGNVWYIVAIGSMDCDYRISLIPTGNNQEVKTVIPKFPDDEYGLVTTPERLYVSEDDMLYVGGYEAGLNGFNLKTRKPVFSVENEIQHGMTMVNGKLFGGTYANGNIYMLDTAKPIDFSIANRYGGNPRIVKSGVTGVMRHYNAADTTAGFGLIAGIADYGGKEGGVFLCTYKDDKPQVKYYGGVIPGENIVGMAYRDGYIYVSSTVTVGVQTPHEEAHVAKVDARTGETVLTSALNIPEAGAKFLKIGELAFGPDGLLYGVGDAAGTVFALNPSDLSVVKYKCMFPGVAPSGGVGSSRILFGAEGNLYAIVNNTLQIINPETLESTQLWAKAAMFAIDNDGNIIKQTGASSNQTTLELIRVNERQRLELMIKNAKKYYKSEDYSAESYKSLEAALAEAEKINIGIAHTDKISKVARKLTLAIRRLVRVYDEEAGFGYPFDEITE